jgi:hypothetical protein
MPVILGTWEAKIRRILDQVQPRQGVCETPISINSWAKWWCLSSSYMEAKIGRISFRPTQAKSLQDSIPTEKAGHGGAHILLHLLWEV